jgi:hypothetical protein
MANKTEFRCKLLNRRKCHILLTVVSCSFFRTSPFVCMCFRGSALETILEHTLQPQALVICISTRDYTSHITITHRLVFSVTVCTALLGNVFQQWTFLCFQAHVRAGWQPAHTNLPLSNVVLRFSRNDNWSSLYSLGTGRKETQLPTVTHVYVLHSRYLAMAASLALQFLRWEHMPQYVSVPIVSIS